MIVAMAPRYNWKPNENGVARSIEEACQLARRWGVPIPDYVEFHVAPPDYPLGHDTYAKTTTFREFDGTIIQWERLFNYRGKIPFLIRHDVLRSDEAIVAVIGHEVYELERLRDAFDSREPIEKWDAETCPTNEGNFHCEAWDHADGLIEKMRGMR